MVIEVVSYNPSWPQFFEKEATLIKEALGDNSLNVHHVGSTAVPGLAAKPRIDIIVVAKDLQNASHALEGIGYKAKGEINIPFRLYFSKEKGQHRVNLHLYEDKNPEIDLNLLFRDYLRNNAKAKDDYAALKFYLLTQKESHLKNNSRFTGYSLGKDKFIKDCLSKAGFKGLCVRFCSHYDEWKAACLFRQKYFFDKVPVSDPYTWTFDHKDHVHFVLYQGVTIIGYAHIQLWPEKRAAMRIIVIDEPYRDQGFGGYFLDLCERWLKQQDVDVLHIESSPEAYRFYAHHKYVEMPFNDPEKRPSCSEDIAVGKKL